MKFVWLWKKYCKKKKKKMWKVPHYKALGVFTVFLYFVTNSTPFTKAKQIKNHPKKYRNIHENLPLLIFCIFFRLNFLPLLVRLVVVVAAVAVAVVVAVVNCNLKNITANCQNALTFTNYFAGSANGSLHHRCCSTAAPLCTTSAIWRFEMRNGSGRR